MHTGGWWDGDGIKEHARRRARYLALESLYESETSRHDAMDALGRRITELMEEDPSLIRRGADAFSRATVEGVLETRDEADELIAVAAPKYPVSTLAVVDRNILRLAIWELLTDTSAPVAAVVNEAVQLAHRYGGENSPGFVNGVLRTVSATILTRLSAAAAAAADSEQSTRGE
ncbi:MAG TPA: transcription antitermination factor NusB [Dehalococcoidia bacterium]|nr:transcription antitermination factor NusB [Dehalococcoidia bacterium]